MCYAVLCLLEKRRAPGSSSSRTGGKTIKAACPRLWGLPPLSVKCFYQGQNHSEKSGILFHNRFKGSDNVHIFKLIHRSAPFQVLRFLLRGFLLSRPFLIRFELRPDRGLFFRCGFLAFAVFPVGLNRFGKVSKGNNLACLCFLFQSVHGRRLRGIVDDTVKVIVVLLDSVLDMLQRVCLFRLLGGNGKTPAYRFP